MNAPTTLVNSPEFDDQTLTDTFQQTCILVRVQCKALGLNRTDKVNSEDITRQKRATQGAAKVIVSRLPGADVEHKKLIALQAATKDALAAESMPCHGEDNWRILPNTRMEALLVRMNGCNAEFKLALEELTRNADLILGAASTNKGDFNIEIPTREELVGAYSMHVQFKPIPDAGNFRHLPEVVAQRLSRELNRNLARAVQESQRDTLHRFVEPLQKFVERLQIFDKRLEAKGKGEDIGRAGVFRDSAIANIKELHAVLDSFNIAGDERLTELSRMLTSIADADPKELREDDNARRAALARAQSTLDNLDKWLNPLPHEVTP